MVKQSRSWWGQKFITALESFTDDSRLKRGRAYASDSRILVFAITESGVAATIRGNKNPYFGVYKEPKYLTEIMLTPISAEEWTEIIARLSSKASVVAKLLLNEVPENIEDCFKRTKLLPTKRKDLITECSCPDYSNPCKHVAGLCYRLAQELDQDPFLLFQLRGLSKEALQRELAKSPLGRILSDGLDESELELKKSSSLHTEPKTLSRNTIPELREFWLGSKRLPSSMPMPSSTSVSAIIVKKQGDYPAFWHKENSFIETMEELYQRVKIKNSNLL